MTCRHSTTKILASRRRRQRQKVLEFKASLGHIPRPYLKRKQKRRRREKRKKKKQTRVKLSFSGGLHPSFFSETVRW